MNQHISKNVGQIVHFSLGEFSYGLPLNTVIRVLPAVEFKPLPKAPEIVMGIINIRGAVIPFVDLRKRFHLPQKDFDPDDRIILAKGSERTYALWVDEVSGVLEVNTEDWANADKVIPFSSDLLGVAKLENDMILIYNLDRFLSVEESTTLDQAMKGKKH